MIEPILMLIYYIIITVVIIGDLCLLLCVFPVKCILQFGITMFSDQDNTALVVAGTIAFSLLMVVVFTLVLLRRKRAAARRTTDNRASDNMSLPDSIIETR